MSTPITLWCLEYGSSSFSVTIGNDNSIFDLKKAIFEEISVPDNVKAKNLSLWSVNFEESRLESNTPDVLMTDENEIKTATQKVGNTFNGVQGNNIRVIVRVPVATAQPVAVQQSLPLQDEDAEVAVDAEVVVKPSVANEPSLSTFKSIPKDTYLPENASQFLRYYELWNKPYDKWPSLHEFSEYLRGVKKDRAHNSFKKEIEVLKQLFSEDHPAQLRLAHLEGQLKIQQTPRKMKKIRRIKVAQLTKLLTKKDVVKEEIAIAQDSVVLGGYRRISQHYNDFHEASTQLVKRHLSDGNDEDLKDKEVVGKSVILKKNKTSYN